MAFSPQIDQRLTTRPVTPSSMQLGLVRSLDESSGGRIDDECSPRGASISDHW
jgi:hypothetical protein